MQRAHTMSEVNLPCSTPKCHNTPQNIAVSTARALFEYRLRHDPKYIFRLSCDACKKNTKYTYEEIIGLLPPEKRPQPLPNDHFWAYVLFDLEAWKRKDHRAQLGGRVLVQRLTSEPSGDWYGILRSLSPYAPTLKVGNYIKGKPRGKYEICLFVIEGGNPVPIPQPPQIPKTNSFGLFVSPKDNEADLLCANIFCSNPSCHHIYSTMTFTKFTAMIHQEQLNEDSYDEVTFQPTIKQKCPVCGTERVIDESSFEGLYKEEK
jgi:hypothetical protein